MPKKGSKKVAGIARTAQGFRKRGPGSADKGAFVMPEEMEVAKALVRSGDAGVDQGAINRAQAAVRSEIDVNRIEQSTNLSMDDTDVLEESTARVLEQARTSAPREAGALISVMSNALDDVQTDDADQRQRIAAIQQKLVRSFSQIAPDESPLSPCFSLSDCFGLGARIVTAARAAPGSLPDGVRRGSAGGRMSC
jgi:hypothetical protein